MSSALEDELGYDPHPELTHYRGTPIPPIQDPLVRTPGRWDIADSVYWHTPPWTVLRNASTYLYYVMDYACDEDITFTLQDVPRHLWHRALEQARPGEVSKGSYVLWSLILDLNTWDEPCDWPDTAHKLDYRPLAYNTREQLYARQAYWRHRRKSRFLEKSSAEIRPGVL